MAHDKEEAESGSETATRHERAIDFSRYSKEQLEELSDSLDGGTHPLMHAALLAELDRRKNSPADAMRWDGRYSRSGALLGWLEAKLRRSPLHGDGDLEIQQDHVVMRGRQRTWLGISIERALVVTNDRIRNVIATEHGVRYEVRRRAWLAQRIEFRPADSTMRHAIVAKLPSTRTTGFSRYGAQLLAFEEELRSHCTFAWLTLLLVASNMLAFAATWILSGSLDQIMNTPLALALANVGPSTLDGQWWRLLSAVFLHGDPAHLLLNMWALSNIGRLSERLYGRVALLFIYLACGLLASLSSLMWDPARSTIGASGAIFGLFGAFLAYLLLNRHQVPRGIFRSHWLPTLLFVGFNLVSSAFQPRIDNAAHIGGVLSGFILGLVLTPRPGVVTLRSSMRLARAGGVVAACAVGALFYLHEARGPMPVAQRFMAQRTWYVAGEAKAIAASDQVLGAAAAGVITDEAIGARMKQDVLPFWREASQKLRAEAQTLHGEEQRYATALTEFAELRKEWIEAVIAATSGRDPDQARVARAKAEAATAVVARIERLSNLSATSREAGGLVNLPWLQRLQTRLAFGEQRCVSAPAGYEIDVSEDDSPTDLPAVKKEIGCRTQRQFLRGEFEELDAALTKAAADTDDLPTGDSTLAAMADGLSDLLEYGNGNVEQYLRQLALWRRIVPESRYPYMIEAEIYHQWAWSARGHGTVDQVTQQAWALFSFRNEMAQAALDEYPPQGQRDALWCGYAMALAHDRSQDLEPIEKVFRLCSAEHPDYYVPRRAMLRALMPRWRGSAEKVSQFIQQESATVPELERDVAYTRLYWTYASLEQDSVNIFDDSFADWERMRRGFTTLIQRNPESDLVLNAYARFACLAKDGITYYSLRNEVMRRRSATAWTRKTTFAGCNELMRASARAVEGEARKEARERSSGG